MLNVIFVLFMLESFLFGLNWAEFVERRGKDE